jgi:hypothetical protein
MRKVLFTTTVAIAVLIVSGADQSAFAQISSSGASQAPRPSPRPGGQISTSRPAPSPGTSRRPTPSPRSIIAFRPPREQRMWPLRVPWFGLVYVDSIWWSQYDVGQGLRPPVVRGTDDRRPVGGLQLDVEPRNALVYVDAWYMGVVDTFSGYFNHLDLAAGPHVIELLASGYDPISVEILVTPGRTTTYRMSLNRR